MVFLFGLSYLMLDIEERNLEHLFVFFCFVLFFFFLKLSADDNESYQSVNLE